MIDGPTAAVIISAILGVVAAIVKFLPAQRDVADSPADIARLQAETEFLKQRLEKLEERQERQDKTVIEWLKARSP